MTNLPAIQFPLKSLTKREIDDFIIEWLNDALSAHQPDELFVGLKQLELGVKDAIDKLQFTARTMLEKRLDGARETEILGHRVEIRSRANWVYSLEIDKLKREQKNTLKIKQLEEQNSGKATREDSTSYISVTIKKGD